MNKERINSNFDINAKYQSMVEEANKIINVYLETSNLYDDGRYSLAYDVKNYLPKLQQEKQHYKHIIDELEKWLEEEIKSWTEAINEERDYELVNEFAFKCNIYEEVLNKLQELKGSEK